MDREQEEMKSLGLFGVCKEASKIILSWRRIFTQITLTLILPLSFLILLHIELSNLFYWNICYKSKHFKWQLFILFQSVLLSLLLSFSFVSTSAVVYTIASIFAAKDVTFKRVMSAVPKVLERLVWTFLVAVAVLIVYIIITVFILVLISCLLLIAIGVSGRGVRVSLKVLIAVLNIIGFVYINMMWQLASVVTVLEGSWDLGAIMLKSHMLMWGKMGSSIFLLLTPMASLVSILILFQEMVVKRWSVSPVEGAAFGVLCFLLLSFLFLFWLVVQTVLYFVCKSYFNENIDKLALANRLEGYRGTRVVSANEGQDVQQEQNQV